MCTALSLLTFKKEHLFGRNMDLEYTFGQRPVVVPRNYEYVDKVSGENKKIKYAITGMASVMDNHPLFAEAINEEVVLGLTSLMHIGKRTLKKVWKICHHMT